MRGGYLTIGRWRGAPVRIHWTLPLGALVFGQGRFIPGFWLGFFLIVLIHEIGHAVLVRRYRYGVVSIDVHALGGVCRWAGSPTAVQRAVIAWGGVLAQGVAMGATSAALAIAGPPETPFAAQLMAAFTTANGWMIAFNLLPVAPFDGAEAWKLPGLLIKRLRLGVLRARARKLEDEIEEGGFEYQRRVATLDRYSAEPAEAVRGEVDDALRRLADDPKKTLH